jgi:23S rRNA (uracil1939-C5)-methyltransferase
MVNIVTSSDEPELIKEYSEKLLNEFPQITTIINNISAKKALIALGDFEKIIYGPGFIIDEIGDYKYQVSANSFFQSNTIQAEQLYNVALEYAGLKGDEIVYDLYSGAGTISLFLSKYSKAVYGIEVVDSAVEDAEVNKKLNETENVFFFKADLYKTFLPIVNENNLPDPDVVILDPPRSGMHLNTVTDVITLSPQKIVYVSCNPTTQARDIKLFVQSGYELVKMRPVDMFPHTYHIENVVLLTKC